MWVKLKIYLFMAISFLIVSAMPTAASDLWYEDNNLARSGGMPEDFIEKFKTPEKFSLATKHIDVYLIRANVLSSLDDDFIKTLFIPYLDRNGIQLAVDAGGATWGQYQGRLQLANQEIALLERLKRLGRKADYISLQSVLSKPLRIRDQVINYTLDQRINDVLVYAQKVKAILPDVQIGIIDALPSHGKDYKEPYLKLKEAMDKAGLKLSYIHLDMPFEIPKEQRHGVTWEQILEIENFVENELGLKFGYFVTSAVGGRTSNKSFHIRAISDFICYSASGGTPQHYILSSWFRYPQETIPDTATGEDYSAMRTVLEIGRQIEQSDKEGVDWILRQKLRPDWPEQCGVEN